MAQTKRWTASWWRRWRYPERLRRGTRSLITALIRRRCKIWIYTSSGRCPRYLKSWFANFGIPVEGVVNLDRHERTVGLRGPSKFPPAFGIDLHVDDSPGVAMEGADHRFPVLVVAPHDPDVAEPLGGLSQVAEPGVFRRAAGHVGRQLCELRLIARPLLIAHVADHVGQNGDTLGRRRRYAR